MMMREHSNLVENSLTQEYNNRVTNFFKTHQNLPLLDKSIHSQQQKTNNEIEGMLSPKSETMTTSLATGSTEHENFKKPVVRKNSWEDFDMILGGDFHEERIRRRAQRKKTRKKKNLKIVPSVKKQDKIVSSSIPSSEAETVSSSSSPASSLDADSETPPSIPREDSLKNIPLPIVTPSWPSKLEASMCMDSTKCGRKKCHTVDGGGTNEEPSIVSKDDVQSPRNTENVTSSEKTTKEGSAVERTALETIDSQTTAMKTLLPSPAPPPPPRREEFTFKRSNRENSFYDLGLDWALQDSPRMSHSAPKKNQTDLNGDSRAAVPTTSTSATQERLLRLQQQRKNRRKQQKAMNVDECRSVSATSNDSSSLDKRNGGTDESEAVCCASSSLPTTPANHQKRSSPRPSLEKSSNFFLREDSDSQEELQYYSPNHSQEKSTADDPLDRPSLVAKSNGFFLRGDIDGDEGCEIDDTNNYTSIHHHDGNELQMQSSDDETNPVSLNSEKPEKKKRMGRLRRLSLGGRVVSAPSSTVAEAAAKEIEKKNKKKKKRLRKFFWVRQPSTPSIVTGRKTATNTAKHN